MRATSENFVFHFILAVFLKQMRDFSGKNRQPPGSFFCFETLPLSGKIRETVLFIYQFRDQVRFYVDSFQRANSVSLCFTALNPCQQTG